MKKRVIELAVLFLVVVSLASCNAQSETTPLSSEMTPEQTQPSTDTTKETYALTTLKPKESMSNEERRESYLDSSFA